MQKFAEVVENRHQYAQEWKKRTGGKVMGYLCTYAPEEIIYAAGVLPVRILGSHEPQDVVEPHIYTMWCPFCRDCLAQGLLGRYDYLDGIMIAKSCMHITHTFWSWTLHVPLSYSYFLHMPAKVADPHAKPLYINQLQTFKKSIEEWTGKTITDKDLDRAIEVYNTNRRLMKQIYELRKSDYPPLTGVEAMEMVLSSMFMDKAEHNQLLEEYLKELSQKEEKREAGVRLMMVGSEDDDREFLRLTESLGATVVIDEHCTGSRYFWNEVVPGKDRLAAIADRYLQRPPCPVKDFGRERIRFPHILKLLEDYRVQGAILIQQKFCDPHEFDIPPLMGVLKEKGIPSLFLEFDILVPAGQFRTRVEAFLEMLQLEMV